MVLAKNTTPINVKNYIIKEDPDTTTLLVYTNWDNIKIGNSCGYMKKGTTIDLRNFCMPTTRTQVTSQFGYRWGRMHNGIDIKVYTGDSIYSAFPGKVRVVGYSPKGYGYYIVVRHPNGLETLYGHLSKQLIKVNQEVASGEAIGIGGNTGRSTGPHLHFEIRICSTPLDPSLLFDFPHQDLVGDTYTTTEDYCMKDQGGPTVIIVEEGQTLHTIAELSHTTVGELCRLNGIGSKTTLKSGQKIRVK